MKKLIPILMLTAVAASTFKIEIPSPDKIVPYQSEDTQETGFPNYSETFNWMDGYRSSVYYTFNPTIYPNDKQTTQIHQVGWINSTNSSLLIGFYYIESGKTPKDYLKALKINGVSIGHDKMFESNNRDIYINSYDLPQDTYSSPVTMEFVWPDEQ